MTMNTSNRTFMITGVHCNSMITDYWCAWSYHEYNDIVCCNCMISPLLYHEYVDII